MARQYNGEEKINRDDKTIDELLNIEDKILPDDEYFKTETKKTILVLHHTAGSHRPDWTIDSWDRDQTSGGKTSRIATSYVIGGKSTRGNDDEFDGKVYRAFEDKYWAYHLGLKTKLNSPLNKHSIGIEICNYGPLTLSKNGEFLTYVNSVVSEEDVIDLGKSFRGYRYWHNYSDRQLESLEFLMKKIISEHDINPMWGLKELLKRKKNISDMSVEEKQNFLNQKGFLGMNGKKLKVDGVIGANTKYAERTYNDIKRGDANAFEHNSLSNDGGLGIWSHTSYRKDKYDVYPHPKLIEILKRI